MAEAEPLYSENYERALSLAAQLHRRQVRKADEGIEPTIPYVAHLLEVSALVWTGGGDEDTAIAGLFHDAFEDQFDGVTEMGLREQFSPRVWEIVAHCTDGTPGQPRHGGTWLERKVPYLARLYEADHDALLVTAADKISNARAILDDLAFARSQADPGAATEALWSRFNVDRQAIAWYYREVLSALELPLTGNPLVSRLTDLVRMMTLEAQLENPARALRMSDEDFAVATRELVEATARRGGSAEALD